MRNGVQQRSFATQTELARAAPSRSLLNVNVATYTDPSRSLIFLLYGLAEEMIHSGQGLGGHIRTIRLLERDSKQTLDRLINGREDVWTAKETILQNELACARIHDNCKEFVEVLDQYAMQAMINEGLSAGFGYDYLNHFKRVQEDFATPRDTNGHQRRSCLWIYEKPEQFVNAFDQQVVQAVPDVHNALAAREFPDNEWFGAELIQQQIATRGTSHTQLFTKLERLEKKFGTSLLPKTAGFLALNIPLIDMEDTPTSRAETVADIDVYDRFDAIYTAFMNDVESTGNIPTIADFSWNDDLNQYVWEENHKRALDSVVADLSRALTIDIDSQRRAEPPLPLLDLPIAHTPPSTTILADARIDDIISKYSPLIQDIFADAFLAFAAFGCVTIYAKPTQPIGYLPNIYLSNQKVGSRHYYHELFESVAANGVIDQLITQSIANTTTALHCPFCGADHNPRYNTECTWDAFLNTLGIAKAHADQWEEYLEKTAPVLDEFVTSEVPGESQLAAYRGRRENAS